MWAQPATAPVVGATVGADAATPSPVPGAHAESADSAHGEHGAESTSPAGSAAAAMLEMVTPMAVAELQLGAAAPSAGSRGVPQSPAPLPHPALPPPPPLPPPGATTQLLFDYPGQPGQKDYLVVPKGSTVQVSPMADHASPWLLVVHGGQQGYVPRAYTSLGAAP